MELNFFGKKNWAYFARLSQLSGKFRSICPFLWGSRFSGVNRLRFISVWTGNLEMELVCICPKSQTGTFDRMESASGRGEGG